MWGWRWQFALTFFNLFVYDIPYYSMVIWCRLDDEEDQAIDVILVYTLTRLIFDLTIQLKDYQGQIRGRVGQSIYAGCIRIALIYVVKYTPWKICFCTSGEQIHRDGVFKRGSFPKSSRNCCSISVHFGKRGKLLGG